MGCAASSPAAVTDISEHRPQPSADQSEAGKCLGGKVAVGSWHGSSYDSSSSVATPPTPQLCAPQLPPARADTPSYSQALEALAEQHSAQMANIAGLVTSIFRKPLCIISVTDDLGRWTLGGTAAASLGPQLLPHQQQLAQLALEAFGSEVGVVEDTASHERYRDAPFVTGQPGIRFIAGAPLKSTRPGSAGRLLGTICMLDTSPGQIDPMLLLTLSNFASLAAQEANKWQDQQAAAAEAAAAAAAAAPTQQAETGAVPLAVLRQAQSFAQGMLLVDVSQQDWPIIYCNPAWTALTDMDVQQAASPCFWQLFRPWAGCAGSASSSASESESGSLTSEGSTDLRAALLLQSVVRCVGEGSPLSLRILGPRKQRPLRVNLQPADAQASAAGARSPAQFWFVLAAGARGMASQPSSSFTGSPQFGSGSRWVSSIPSNSSFVSTVTAPSARLEQLQERGQVTPEAFAEVELGSVLGVGSYGRVHRAMWKGVLVACKVMEAPCEPESNCAPTSQSGLLEAVLSRDLSHPNIVQTFDFATRVQQMQDAHGGVKCMRQVWIIQQYCNRGTLLECVARGALKETRQRGGPPNAIAILQTAQEIASAMTYLHSHGIIHSDLTSNNVLLNASTRDHRRVTALVSDFGLSRVAAPSGGAHTYSFGTVSHMPPELLAEGLVSKAVDVYSFGVLLWEMWQGERAWAGCSPPQVLHAVSTGKAKLQLPEDAHPGIRELCHRCLDYDHRQRPTFAKVLEEVTKLLAAELAAAEGSERGRQGGYVAAKQPSLDGAGAPRTSRSQQARPGSTRQPPADALAPPAFAAKAIPSPFLASAKGSNK